MEIFHLKQSSTVYPSSLQTYLGRHVPAVITGLGNPDILDKKKLAFFCSAKCPGHLILKAHDLSHTLKKAGVTVISGFHSPVERECLTILLRGSQPVVICPARCIEGMRIKKEHKKSLDEGRLLFLSPFKKNQRRNTVETAMERSHFVAALADAVFIAYTSPNSKMEKFCQAVLKWGKPIYTFESDANQSLIHIGAKPLTPDLEFFRIKE